MKSQAAAAVTPPQTPVPQHPGYRRAFTGLERRLLEGPATVSAVDRQATAAGQELPGALGEYLALVAAHAYRITDEQVAALRQAGHTDDALFELTVCAAFGAARRRLEAGLAAIAEAYEST